MPPPSFETPTRPDDACLARRRWLGGLIGLGLLGQAGCAHLGGPQVITLDAAELDRLIARHFPVRRRLLDLLDMTLALPRLQLLPERNRLAVALELATQERLGGRMARAQLDFDTALRYEPRDATLRLTQVRVLQLRLGGAGPLPRQADEAAGPGAALAESRWPRLAEPLAQALLDDLVLYTVPAERLDRLRGLGLVPGAVTVTARGVEITLAQAG